MTDQPATTARKEPLPPSIDPACKYETHILPYLEWVRWWRRDGLIQADIASKLGVTPAFLGKSKQEYPELAKALERGRDWHNHAVESALIARALGYKVDEREVTIVTETGGKADGRTRRTERTSTRYWPPDTQACLGYLYNRDGENFKDRRQLDANINVTKPVEIIYPPRPEEKPDGSDSDDGPPPEPGN